MTSTQKVLVGVLVALTLLFGFLAFRGGKLFGAASGPAHYQTESFLQGLAAGARDQFTLSNVGALVSSATASFTSTFNIGGLLTTDGGVLDSYNLSTTTQTSRTLAASDLLNYSSVTMYPSVGAITITLPASSTLSALVPTAGDIQRQCWYNATTTAVGTITFASGTGVDLEIASTTVLTGATSLILNADNSACFEFQRKGGSGTSASDIIARFLRYSDGD